MDTQIIKNLYQNETLRPIFEQFSKRELPVKVTTVDSVLKSSLLTRAQVIDLFKKLAEAGAGEFKTGRRGMQTRIEWAYNVSDIGKFVSGDVTDVKPLYETEEPTERKGPKSEDVKKHPGRPRGSKNKVHAATNTHTYLLRDDYRLHFRLPKDFSTAEAKRLAEFVQSLPL